MFLPFCGRKQNRRVDLFSRKDPLSRETPLSVCDHASRLCIYFESRKGSAVYEVCVCIYMCVYLCTYKLGLPFVRYDREHPALAGRTRASLVYSTSSSMLTDVDGCRHNSLFLPSSPLNIYPDNATAHLGGRSQTHNGLAYKKQTRGQKVTRPSNVSLPHISFSKRNRDSTGTMKLPEIPAEDAERTQLVYP